MRLAGLPYGDGGFRVGAGSFFVRAQKPISLTRLIGGRCFRGILGRFVAFVLAVSAIGHFAHSGIEAIGIIFLLVFPWSPGVLAIFGFGQFQIRPGSYGAFCLMSIWGLRRD